MSNLYQMRIKVITVKEPEDPHPQVNWIEPDPELNAFKLPNVYMAAISKGRPIIKYTFWSQFSDCDPLMSYLTGEWSQTYAHMIFGCPLPPKCCCFCHEPIFGS